MLAASLIVNNLMYVELHAVKCGTVCSGFVPLKTQNGYTFVTFLFDPISYMSLRVLFQLSVLTGVRFLQTSLENVLKQGDPNSESDGWLLENSFMETARINLNIIKNLGKINQIDMADNGDPNIDIPSTSKAHYGPENVLRKHAPEAC